MFYNAVWDPILIIFQIVSLQCSWYLSLGTTLFLFHWFFSSSLSLDSILDGDCITMFSSSGWTIILALLLTAPISSYLILIIVGRFKKCLDHTCTLYGIHYLLCILWSGIPSSWQYYLIILITATITDVIAEYLCIQEEMKWIPTGTSSAASSTSNNTNINSSNSNNNNNNNSNNNNNNSIGSSVNQNKNSLGLNASPDHHGISIGSVAVNGLNGSHHYRSFSTFESKPSNSGNKKEKKALFRKQNAKGKPFTKGDKVTFMII